MGVEAYKIMHEVMEWCTVMYDHLQFERNKLADHRVGTFLKRLTQDLVFCQKLFLQNKYDFIDGSIVYHFAHSNASEKLRLPLKYFDYSLNHRMHFSALFQSTTKTWWMITHIMNQIILYCNIHVKAYGFIKHIICICVILFLFYWCLNDFRTS